jgi:Lrp/AsnC family transcriptional regulator, leucine-responsive regulatory protein
MRLLCVTLIRNSGDEGQTFKRNIAAFAQVLECCSITGEADYILQIIATSLANLSDSVLRRLTRLAGARSIRFDIMLQCVNFSTELLLGYMGRINASGHGVRLGKST